MEEKKMEWKERCAKANEEVKNLKPLIIAECQRLIYLLQNDAETKNYGYNEFGICKSDVLAKAKEVRRDTLQLEKALNQYL